jgi:hypothetical protein
LVGHGVRSDIRNTQAMTSLAHGVSLAEADFQSG